MQGSRKGARWESGEAANAKGRLGKNRWESMAQKRPASKGVCTRLDAVSVFLEGLACGSGGFHPIVQRPPSPCRRERGGLLPAGAALRAARQNVQCLQTIGV